MNRREMLTITGGGLLGASALGADAAAPSTKPKLTPAVAAMPRRLPGDGKRPLPVNKPRAYEVLDRLGVDGLIAMRPINVYYLTNTWPIATQFGGEFPALATFARNPAQPSFFIGTTGSGNEFFNGDREVPEFISYGGVSNWQDFVGASPEQLKVEPKAYRGFTSSNGFAVEENKTLSPREKIWQATQAKYGAEAAPSIAWALVRALRESGLDKGRIAVDDMRIAYMLQTIGFETVTILPYGDNIFREIRLIKQPHEVALMRKAQIASQHAARASMHALEPGMSYDDARMRFIAEAAAHGSEIAFLLVGVSQALLPDEVVREGRSYMIDCGATYQHYMGDFARTVSIGEPSIMLKKRFAAQQVGRHAALEQIRPGMSFAAIEKIARDTMLKAGMPSDVISACTLHSVGLQHDDQPTRSDVLPYFVRDEMVLEAGMTVTLDLPFIEIGWGAGHNEDLLLITETGYDLMNSPDEPLIVV